MHVKRVGRQLALAALFTGGLVGALIWSRGAAESRHGHIGPNTNVPSERVASEPANKGLGAASSKLEPPLKPGKKVFPTHSWFRDADLNAPPRKEVLSAGKEITVRGSSCLGCTTRLSDDFLGVSCSPELTPRDLAIIRGAASETWVEPRDMGFVAHLPPGGVVTVALGWDEESRVIRVVRNAAGVAVGNVLGSESLIVMSSEEDEPHAHFYGFELDHEIEYWVRIQRPGCGPRVLSGSVIGGHDDPLGNAEPREIGDVQQYGRPEGPISFDPTYDRAYAQLQEWYEKTPKGLEERCLAVRSPPLRGRLWPLRPGDVPELQPVGHEREPTDQEFAKAHPRAPVVGGAGENGCRVRRVRSFVEVDCLPKSNFGNALGHWTFEGQVLKSSKEEGRFKVRFKTSDERKVDSTLIWERGSLDVSLFASKISSHAGEVEPSKGTFFRGENEGRLVTMRLRTSYSPAYQALDYPPEVRSSFSRPEGGSAQFDVQIEGSCDRTVEGYAEWGIFSGREVAERSPKISGASAGARYYFHDNSTLAVDPGERIVWFTEPAELRRYGLNEEDEKLAPECRLKNFGPLRQVSVQSLLSTRSGH